MLKTPLSRRNFMQQSAAFAAVFAAENAALFREQQEQITKSLAADSATTPGLQNAFQQLLQAENAVLDEALRGNTAEAYQAFFGQAVARQEALQTELGELRATLKLNTETALKTKQQETQRAAIRHSLIVAGAIMVLLGLGWRLKTFILKSLTTICTTVAESCDQLTTTAQQFSVASRTLAEMRLI